MAHWRGKLHYPEPLPTYDAGATKLILICRKDWIYLCGWLMIGKGILPLFSDVTLSHYMTMSLHSVDCLSVMLGISLMVLYKGLTIHIKREIQRYDQSMHLLRIQAGKK